MATSKTFSFAGFVEYGNKLLNNDQEFSEAVRKDIKKTVRGIMNEEELGMIDTCEISMDNTLALVPKMVSKFMSEEDRAFTLPAPNDKTTSATLKLVDKEAETKTGTIQFGPNAGQ